MNNLIPFTELQQHFNNESFVLKTQQQIIKDFEKFNLFFDSDFHITPLKKEEIEDKIAEQVAELMKEGESRFLQFLYTIDIAESQFLSIISSEDFIKLIAEKILFREAYKVFLRSNFSG